MNVTVVGLCRRNKKYFILVTLSNMSGSKPISVAAKTMDGRAIPASVFIYNRPDAAPNQFVVVLADMPGAHRAFVELSSNDTRNTPASFSVSFERAKWQSRLAYRTNRRLCDRIKDYDRIGDNSRVSFHFWDCIPNGEYDIQRSSLTIPYFEDSAVTITCFDQNDNPVDIFPVILGNRKAKWGKDGSITLREIQFSAHIPVSAGTVFFVGQDQSHPELNGFDSLPINSRNDNRAKTEKTMENAQIANDYGQWFDGHRATLADIEHQRAVEFPHSPQFSIVVPLYKTPVDLFTDMVNSVLSQSYGNWELILVNSTPEDAELADAVASASSNERRIKVVTLEKNLGISENTNKGIELAEGDFVCFFDHDDVIEPDLLFEYTKAINEHDDIDLIYCDEDKLFPDGNLGGPFLKPDFNLDLLRNNNYICHMLCIRKELLDTLEPNSPEFDGAQDHNLTLQASEHARRIHHVARVLYHWRLSESSTATNADNKPYASAAGIKAVKAHLERLGIKAQVKLSRRPFTYQIDYDVPEDKPLVSIIIPTKDLVPILEVCLLSIFEKSTYENFEVILVENNSEDPFTFEYYKSLPERFGKRIRVEYWPNEFNFSKLINFGVSKAKGDYLLFLNNDTEVLTPNWIEHMLGMTARKEVGIVGTRLLYPDDTIQHAGLALNSFGITRIGVNLPKGNWGYFALADCTQDLTAVTAACMMTKRTVFDEVEGMTEELQVAFNDVDFCLKVRNANYLVVYDPDVELYHYESISRGTEDNLDKRTRFHQELSQLNYRWARFYEQGDPYFNKNLSRQEPYCYYYHL